MFNMLGNLILSRDLVNPQSVEGSGFFAAMTEVMEASGHPNVADLFPWLKRLDPQGLTKKMDRGKGNTLRIIAEFVAERLEKQQLDGAGAEDFLDVLQESYQNGRDEKATISNHELNIIILELFFAGSETTSSSIEWVMVELLRHPEVMIKAKNELAQVVGKSNKFEENHLKLRLPYLEAVIKETLRLHPPAPFLVPRRAVQDTKLMGYHIPKDTQLLVNAWAIGRDPERWEDPLSFKPERFLGSEIDYIGQNFELIPFGAGRRICAGIPLAHRMLHFVSGTLLHEFDWEVDEISRNDLMDMRGRLGLTVRKLAPLTTIPKRRST
ncbi:cytochrome [Sesamum angolense]|uniref:Cytochrome n=1 Tax=Sesamum angolense TaxID=2727404 RepID=A0AAE2BSZ3_9LAMI|nr:cytochrome [Sesamum angolense]